MNDCCNQKPPVIVNNTKHTYYDGLTRLEMAVACKSGVFTSAIVAEREYVTKTEASQAIQSCLKAGVIRRVSWGKYKVC
jgi:predicted transcriptional regulator of viral defense system